MIVMKSALGNALFILLKNNSLQSLNIGVFIPLHHSNKKTTVYIKNAPKQHKTYAFKQYHKYICIAIRNIKGKCPVNKAFYEIKIYTTRSGCSGFFGRM